MRMHARKPKGITLIEMLVYMAVFAVIFLSIIQFVISVVVNNQRADQKREMERITSFIVEHMNDSFSKAQSIDTATSSFGVQTGTLRITRGGSYYQYSLSNSTLMFSNTGAVAAITNADTRITQLRFDRVNDSKTGIPEAVRLTLGIESLKDPNVKKTVITAFTIK